MSASDTFEEDTRRLLQQRLMLTFSVLAGVSLFYVLSELAQLLVPGVEPQNPTQVTLATGVLGLVMLGLAVRCRASLKPLRELSALDAGAMALTCWVMARTWSRCAPRICTNPRPLLRRGAPRCRPSSMRSCCVVWKRSKRRASAARSSCATRCAPARSLKAGTRRARSCGGRVIASRFARTARPLAPPACASPRPRKPRRCASTCDSARSVYGQYTKFCGGSSKNGYFVIVVMRG